jgi:carboxyl-terminal processing protease
MLRVSKVLYRGLVLFLLLFLPLAVCAQETDTFDVNRARLLGHMLQQQLSYKHYSQKPTDDNLSEAAFDLYLKQLDFQKRFLLQSDVAVLESYRDSIDDAIRRGRLELPLTGRALLDQRIGEVRILARELLAQGIDPEAEEFIESDPEKYEFPVDSAVLRERWRKIIKMQVLNRYISLREDEIGVDDAGALLPVTDEQREQLFVDATEKVGKSMDSLFERMLDETEQDHYDRYLNAIARAYDPHTSYMAPTSKEDFDIQMSGSLEGIGATLREDDGLIKVVRIIPGSAAAKQGMLEADDTILQVAEGKAEPADITDTRIRDAVALIRGKKGTEVRLVVRKQDGRHMVIPIIRDVVEIEETFVKGTTVIDEQSGETFGYVKLPSFYRDYSGKTDRNCTDDLREELKQLKKQNISGLILDLRNNGGGSLGDAVSTTGLFIKTGPVVQVRDGEGTIRVMSDDDRSVEYDGPMIVLVNRFSASASEILAGALQDYGRAIIVGDAHTHGKGTVQALLDLDRLVNLRGMDKYMPLGAVKVTIQKFYRISGESTQERGVSPDIVLPSRLDGLESGERYLDNALPWDNITSADYSKWSQGIDDLPELQLESRARVTGDGIFREIANEAESARQRREETAVSLKLSDLLDERAQLRELDKKAQEQGAMALTLGDDSDEPLSLDDEIKDDPYVEEGMTLLLDLIAES